MECDSCRSMKLVKSQQGKKSRSWACRMSAGERHSLHRSVLACGELKGVVPSEDCLFPISSLAGHGEVGEWYGISGQGKVFKVSGMFKRSKGPLSEFLRSLLR
mmetsp:Transcript_18265/g.60008  ORF Transcript_18265/g.60008 Transcript_18265/m.60008 type:complete len:103 (-) Transcript_18265:116-424(-)